MFQVFLVDSHILTRTKPKALIFLDFSSLLGSPVVGSGNVPFYLWLHHFPDLCGKFQSRWICCAPQGDSFLPNMHSQTGSGQCLLCAEVTEFYCHHC